MGGREGEAAGRGGWSTWGVEVAKRRRRPGDGQARRGRVTRLRRNTTLLVTVFGIVLAVVAAVRDLPGLTLAVGLSLIIWAAMELRPRRTGARALLEWVRRTVGDRVALVGLVLVLLSPLVQVLSVQPSQDRPMSGDVNVAVGDFTVLDERGQVAPGSDVWIYARGLADDIATELTPELAAIERQGYTVVVWGPDRVGDLSGVSSEERARRMEARAHAIDADVVLSGVLDATTGEAVLSTEFFVPEVQLPGAGELAGLHTLDRIAKAGGELGVDRRARGELRGELLRRVRGLAEFILGVALYKFYSISEAYEHFRVAESALGELGDRKVLYLFLGNALGKLAGSRRDRRQALERARSYYERARGLDARDGDPYALYGRAYLGLAEIAFQRSSGGCQRGRAHREGLEESARLYRQASQDPRRVGGANLGTKVAFGLGRTATCLGFAGLGDDRQGAERLLQSVVRDFDDGNRQVQELASEAHGWLGLLHWPSRGHRLGANDERAVAHYGAAAELSVSCTRRRLFYRQLAEVHRRLGDAAGARQADAEAGKSQPPPDGARRCRLEA